MNLIQLNNYCEQANKSINIEQSEGKPVLSSIQDIKTGRKFFL